MLEVPAKTGSITAALSGVSGENLLNRQQGEPDNITVVPSRTLSLGLKARL
jgi:hypothetical protein